MPFDATNHTFSPPPQKKTLVAHTNRVANPELGEHHMLAAVVVAENVAAEAAVVPSLPQRCRKEEKLTVQPGSMHSVTM